MKKILALCLSAILALSSGSTVFAVNDTAHAETDLDYGKTTEETKKGNGNLPKEEIKIPSKANEMPTQDNKKKEVIVKASVVTNEKARNTKVEIENPEAVIGDQKFATLKEALDAAVSGNIVVLKKSTTLAENAIVKAGVMLLLPISDSDTKGYVKDTKHGDHNPDKSGVKNLDDKILYSKLTIDSNVTLTVNGQVMINAETGTYMVTQQNFILGSYSEIQINQNAKIIVNDGAIFDNFGYVKGKGELVAKAGAEIRDLYTIQHFRGGSHSSAMVMFQGNPALETRGLYGAYPMNESGCANIRVKSTYHSGSSLFGNVKVYAGDVFNYASFPQIDNENGLYRITNGGYIEKTVDSSDLNEVISYEGNYNFLPYETLSFHGGGSLDISGLNLVGMDVSTANYEYPLNNINIVLQDGSYTCNSKFKFLPGSSLTVESGATLTLPDVVYNRPKDDLNPDGRNTIHLVFYKELLDAGFPNANKFTQGKMPSFMQVNNGGKLILNGSVAGDIKNENISSIEIPCDKYKEESTIVSHEPKMLYSLDGIFDGSIIGDTTGKYKFVDITSSTNWSKTSHTLTHEFGDWTSTSETKHTKICKHDSTHTEIDNHHYAWENKNGKDFGTCEECGHTTTLDHDYKDWKATSDGKQHTGTCSRCLGTKTVDHDFSGWSGNANDKDEHTCNTCSHKEEINHDFVWQDTEDGAKHFGKCSRCNKENESFEHVYTWNSISETEHKGICKGCEKEITLVHNFGKWIDDGNGNHTKTCKDCSKKITVTHAFNAWTSISETEHSRTCNSCEKVEKAKHNFGKWIDDGDGNHTKTCKDCGKEITTTHDFGEWTSISETEHSRTCNSCEKVEKTKHTFKEISRTEATYTKNGSIISKCSVCSHKKTETISFIKDTIVPKGTITLGSTIWKTYHEPKGMGKLYQKATSLIFSGQDEETGISKIEYYVSNKALSTKELTNVKWTKGTKVTLSNDGKYVVYVKISDKAHEYVNNQATNTGIINSDIIVIDKILPTLDPKPTEDNIAVGMPSNQVDKINKILDKAIDKITNNTDQAVSNERISLNTANNIKEALAKGLGVFNKIVMEGKANTEIAPEVKDAILATFNNKETIAQYFDIQLQVKDSTRVLLGNINTLEQELPFQVSIPKNLVKEGRTFFVVRIHGDEVTKLPVTIENGILNFRTGEFSTFALAYDDTNVKESNQEKDPANTTDNSENPDDSSVKTGDETNTILWSALGLGCLGIIGIIFFAKRKNTNKVTRKN